LAQGDQHDESQLILLTQSGDGDAFQKLVRAHLPAIHRYAHRMLGDTAEANDVAQEVMVRLWEKASVFNPEQARLTTWLHQIAHNLCIDYFRKQNRMTDLQEADEPESETLALEAEIAQQGHMVAELVSALPERQKSALVLCHYQGLSNREAAEAMAVSVEAVESLLSRARRTLKRQLLERA
jgi:RNA polymerase sigma-70 factor (ECF subfamily)